MEIVPQLISRYSIVLYAVCGIACAYFVLTGVASLRELRRAVFRLERNTVVSRAMGALLKAVLCLIIGAGIYLVAGLQTGKPVSSSLLSDVTTTPVDLIMPTSMATAVITPGQVMASATMASAGFTPTITFLDTSTAPNTTNPADSVAQGDAVTPGSQAEELLPDCTNSNAQIVRPAAGEKVTGAYAVRGTAAVEVGGWYKLEILMPGTIQWAMVGRGDGSVINGVLLENFNAANFAPGVYPFRLVLIGADGGIRAICRIPLTIGS